MWTKIILCLLNTFDPVAPLSGWLDCRKDLSLEFLCVFIVVVVIVVVVVGGGLVVIVVVVLRCN